jgi:hypothetical protein
MYSPQGTDCLSETMLVCLFCGHERYILRPCHVQHDILKKVDMSPPQEQRQYQLMPMG